MYNNSILVFDSWIWSYSVVKELLELLPNENIIYLADRNSFPYGKKNKEQLMDNMLWVIHFFEKNYNPKLILIASNTPSIQVLDELKTTIQTPLFGVFPPIKEASHISQTKKVAILATQSAVESKEITDFINKQVNISETEVFKVNASPMVDLIEPGTFLNDHDTCIDVCREVLDFYVKEKNIDVITLSSTHLPFLKKYIQELYPEIKLLDPAVDVSKDIKNYLEINNLLSAESWSIKVLWTQNESKNLFNNELENIFHKMWFICKVEEVIISDT